MPTGRHRRRRPGRHWLLALALLLLAVRARAAESDGEELHHLQRLALRHAHLDERSRHRLETRLHLAPLLPQLRVSVGRGWEWAYSGGSSGGSTVATLDGDRLSYMVSAQWDLARLLFAHEDLALHRDAERVADWRTQLLLRVARVYSLRCRAVAELVVAKSDEATGRLLGRRAALDMTLAALTGDERIGEKLHRCPAMAGDPAGELEALTPSLPRPPVGAGLAPGEPADPEDRDGG